MTRLPQLTRALTEELGDRVTDGRRVRDNELHCSVHPAAVPALAGLLRTGFGAELLFMAAADRRADRGVFEVSYLFAPAREHWFLHATAAVPADAPAIGSLATFHYPASRFEREISDLFGITAEGHPDPRSLVRHGFWPADYFPLRKDARPREFTDDGRAFPFTEVGGEGVYEIPVGPVHAGIIEPGHFRFSVVGETIIDMKSRLYFTHKGTEKLFEGREPAAGVELAERISGDTTVGHALAFCQALEAAAGMRVPERAKYLRVIFLEMERLYNHVADFGAIANDTGYAVAHSHCFRIRERLLRLNKQLTGNRLLRGGIVPGGVGADLPAGLDLPAEVEAALRDFDEIVGLTLENTLVLDRLEGTG
ncbi:MAG: NADH-quinone oxidoreductase subunit C, partial [Candidatus Rokubacteria bacterium]|nr:NADH-quinone oxidoreductase subunit C [Candidatus Rokubacteria bacterium]